MGKIGYSTYVKERVTGFEGQTVGFPMHDFDDYPELAQKVLGDALGGMTLPACTGDVVYDDTTAVAEDIANLRAALGDVDSHEAFLTAASPGVIAVFLANQYYSNHEAYIGALADAMKREYDTIYQAGLVLQVDCPDLAMSYQMFEDVPSIETFRRRVGQNIEAPNHALRDIPADQVRPVALVLGQLQRPASS